MANGNNMNPIPAIGAYAAILRERGEPLYFPGRPDNQGLREAVDAGLVASALEWAATSERAVGGTYNLTNGDVFMWPNVWPAIARTLGMEPAEPRPFSFANDLPGWNSEWAAIVQKYNLAAATDVTSFAGYNSLIYADMVLSGGRSETAPALNSTIAARQDGFADCIDTEEMLRHWLGALVARRILPR